MTEINFHTLRHVHLVGIGGMSLSGIARVLNEWGYAVSGSDVVSSPQTDMLMRQGIRVHIGHSVENITPDTNYVVISSAVTSDSPGYVEVQAAQALGIPVVNRADMLGALMARQGKGIGVAGTHGKSTTTALTALVLAEAGFKPTALVGANVTEFGGNARVDRADYLVVEADEYDHCFLKLAPWATIITSIEADHFDTYPNLYEMERSFQSYAQLVPEDGFVVANSDSESVKKIIDGLDCHVITYGFKAGADFQMMDVDFRAGETHWQIKKRNKLFGQFHLLVPGRHNIANASAVVALADCLGISPAVAQQVFTKFKGVERRFQIKGDTKNGITVVDDYAHHPTAVKVTLQAARRFFGHRRIVAVFQPHHYNRTRYLFKEFAECFSDADDVVLLDIYAVTGREKKEDLDAVSGEMLADEVAKHSKHVQYAPTYEDALAYLKETLQPNDVVITMGATNIYTVGNALLDATNE